MSSQDGDAAERCPIDPVARQKWLDAAATQRRSDHVSPSSSAATPAPININLLHHHGFTRFSLDSGRWEPDWSRLVLRRSTPTPTTNAIPPTTTSPLPTARQISSIPRALPPTSHHDDPRLLNSAERAALPVPTSNSPSPPSSSSPSPSPPTAANNEGDTGHDRHSGNWVYPSQEMFFAAMKRKGHEANAADMATVVPIHNAVNERAWAEIRAWEAARTSASSSPHDPSCSGPKLLSFAGDSSRLTPRARWRSLLGYQLPFDRHDWVVQRCDGAKVDYVIDFYSGKDEGVPGKSLNFHLDVRPKLNTWEGCKMRAWKAVGWS